MEDMFHKQANGEFQHELEKARALKMIGKSTNQRRARKVLSVLFLIFFISLFLPWQQNINGRGKVTALKPQERPQKIQSIIGGRIEKWHVQEGQRVRKGDTLVLISEVKEKFFDPQLLSKLEGQIQSKQDAISSKADKINALGNNINYIKTGLGLKLKQARNKILQQQMKVNSDSIGFIAAKLEYTVADTQFKRYEQLYKTGLISLTQLETRSVKFQDARSKLVSQENKLNQSRNELINALIELNGIEAEYFEKITKAESVINETSSELFESESDLAKLKIEFANLSIRNNLYVIRAPQDGYIVRALKMGIGETLKEGEEVASIMPLNPSLAVEINVKPMDIPLLYKGCPVRIQFDGWPALVFSGWPDVSVGTFSGLVQTIDYVGNEDGTFRVLVVPDPADAPWPALIRQGSGVYGWAMLGNVTVGYEMWRQFNGFPPDMTNQAKSPKKDYGNGKAD